MTLGARVYHVGRGQVGVFMSESDSMPGSAIVDFDGDYCRVSLNMLEELK